MKKQKKQNKMKAGFAVTLATTLLATSLPLVHAEGTVTSENKGLIINEVYGGGGKAGKDGAPNAPYMYDFIEVYNPTNEDMPLKGLSLKYTNSSGKTVAEYKFEDNAVIKANDYFLLRCEATLGNDGEKGHGYVFEADAYYDEPEAGIGMSDSKGNVQLLQGETVVDAVAWGNPDTYLGEGTSATGLSITTSARRVNFQDTNDNATDFVAVAPSPTKSGATEGEVTLNEVNKIAHLREDASLVGQEVLIEANVAQTNVKTSDTRTVSYVFEPSGAIAVSGLHDVEVGRKVRITGTLAIEEGEYTVTNPTFEYIDHATVNVAPRITDVKEVKNFPGHYVKTFGTVTAVDGQTMTLNDEVTIYMNEAVGSFANVKVGNSVTVSGFSAIVANEARIAVADEANIEVQATDMMEDSLDIEKIAGYSTGVTSKDGGVAEIVKYNKDNNKFYLVNGSEQTIDIVSLDGVSSNEYKQLTKETSINVANYVNSETFAYGDITSIDVNTEKQVVVVSVQEADYTKNGKIVVLNYAGELVDMFDAGVQPDMIKMTADGNYILTANEAEPRLGLANGVDPDGSITIVNYETKETKTVKFDNDSVISKNVHIRNGSAKNDLEPEYIALSDDQTSAYVSLQENNALAKINVANGTVEWVKGFGLKDHSLPKNGLDAANKDGKIDIKPLPIKGAYMPDGISYTTMNGQGYIVTANEGDATEWKEFLNIDKLKNVKNNIQITSDIFAGMTLEEAQAALDEIKNTTTYDDLEVLTDMGNDAIYTLGGRSFAIWNADTMELVFDSGSDFEQVIGERFPQYFNANNKDVKFDGRSHKKGPEPEDVKIGRVGDRVYAYVGIERMGGMMTYDITNPSEAQFVNYKNTRDYSADVAGDVAPEGLEFIDAANSPTNKPLVLMANENSGTVAVMEMQVKETETPTPNPDEDDTTNPDGDNKPNPDEDNKPNPDEDNKPNPDEDNTPNPDEDNTTTPPTGDTNNGGSDNKDDATDDNSPQTGDESTMGAWFAALAASLGGFAFFKRRKKQQQ